MKKEKAKIVEKMKAKQKCWKKRNKTKNGGNKIKGRKSKTIEKKRKRKSCGRNGKKIRK